MASKCVMVALGSNLGDPIDNLQRAAGALSVLSDTTIGLSSIWRSAPVGFTTDVPDFCNAVVTMGFTGSPEALLARLKKIERQLGRERENTPQYESRLIDLDIIDFAGNVSATQGLSLPHPRAHQRLFVLLPLQEVAPEFRFPDRGESLADLIIQAGPGQLEKSIPLIPLV